MSVPRLDNYDAIELPVTFKERALTPSFGYVFDQKWLDPHESIVSILWKFVRMNRLPGQMVIMQLARDISIDPYDGVVARQSDVDIRRLHQALGLPLKIVRGSLVPDSLSSFSNPHFRYCRKCLCRGYHGVVHQLKSVKTCPVHGCSLEIECVECGAMMPYWLSAHLLDAPYRCGSCRKLFASCPPAIVNRRPLSSKARVAITRSRLNHCSYF